MLTVPAAARLPRPVKSKHHSHVGIPPQTAAVTMHVSGIPDFA
jgi:hypothetical protein